MVILALPFTRGSQHLIERSGGVLPVSMRIVIKLRPSLG
jgi:hypothetical protein